jgi:DNA repair exonuclease SbcCD ATPase subunit
MATDEAVTIVSLEVQNVQRVRAVSIRPKGAAVILGGRNEQGKTSILDSIEMAMGGKGAFSERPIRDGARQASIVVDLGSLVVERVITKTGTNLTVRDREGNKLRTPQTILDELCSQVSFDPLAFSRMKGDKQNEILRQLAGLDFSEMDAKRERIYAQRTRLGKDASSVRARAEAVHIPAGTPAEPISVEQLAGEVSAAQGASTLVTEHQGRVQAARDTLERTEAALRRATADRDGARMRLAELERSAPPAPPDPAELVARLREAEEQNRNVARRAERNRLETEANALDEQVAGLTKELDAIDADKLTLIGLAKFPIEGLGLGETGPTLVGVPLSQSSGAQKLKVSVAIGFALNPRLRVLLVRDASLLDDDSLRLVAELAAAQGGQVWLERVSTTGEGCSVLIEDGTATEVLP